MDTHGARERSGVERIQSQISKCCWYRLRQSYSKCFVDVTGFSRCDCVLLKETVTS